MRTDTGADQTPTYTAFAGHKILAHGTLEFVVLEARKLFRKNKKMDSILIFSDLTGKQMDFDLSGTETETLYRLQVYLSPAEAPASGGPGRPKLGVVPREVSLLPRHWEWLSAQSGGASATLRRLVDEARKESSGRDRQKQAQECTYKFMTAIGGDLPGYEEAIRALFARDRKKFRDQITAWPPDVKGHCERLAVPAF